MDVQKHSVHTLVFRSMKRSHECFLSEQMGPAEADSQSEDVLLQCKIRDEFGPVKDIVEKQEAKRRALEIIPDSQELGLVVDRSSEITTNGDISNINDDHGVTIGPTLAPLPSEPAIHNDRALVTIGDHNMLVPRKAQLTNRPIWHAPWKLARVISGHGGWVRCVAVEPANQWFATGSADRIIKIWDMYTGQLKLSLTGHVSTVRGLAVGINQPYLFSCGEDKQVKCWDLEYNKVIRHYHGHLSAVYGLDLHPLLDVLVTCGRDATARVWDMRTKVQIHCLSGHTNTVSQVRCQATDPQIISSSYDSTVRLWDITAGKTIATLTNHKKSVRALVLHPNLNMMATGSPDNLKQWSFPEGIFMQNMSGHNAIINCLAVSKYNVLVSGGDNGSMHFWDWSSAYNFQCLQTAVQPGSIDSEAGIFAMTFDKSDSKLITCEADKTIKMYIQDETATEDTHPLNWKSEIVKRRF